MNKEKKNNVEKGEFYMDNKLKLFRKMCIKEQKDDGRVYYNCATWGFMDFKELLAMEEEEYIEYIADLVKKRYIEYVVPNHKEKKNSAIRLDTLGKEYLFDKDNRFEIGF